MKIFKTKIFHQWTKKVDLEDMVLKQAIDEMLNGQYEANLGGHLYKKRVAIGSKGKRGGVRTIIAFKKEHDVFFVYGFAKNAKANINSKEKEFLKELANDLFLLNDQCVTTLIVKKELIEVK